MRTKRLRRAPTALISAGLLAAIVVCGGLVICKPLPVRQYLDAQLIAAVERKDPVRVTELLDEGADANASQIPKVRRTMWSILNDWLRGKRHPHSDSRSALLVALNGAEPEDHGASGPHMCMGFYTPRYDSDLNEWKIVVALVNHGANVNCHGRDGRTPLMWAASDGSLRIARELMAKGADLSMRDVFGESVIEVAAWDPAMCGLLRRGLPRR